MYVSETLRTAYGDVLWDIYDSSLKWLYEDVEQPDEAYLEPILKEIVVNGAAVDRLSFKMDVALWKDINKNMAFPIPRLARIIPLLFALWNAIKGGSDATTNLLWHCHYNVPSDENQSIVVARILSLCAVHVHRLLQIATAKENLDFYSCLKRFRDSATERVSFKKTLTMMVNLLTTDSSETEPAPATPTPPRRVVLVEERATRSHAGIQRMDISLLKTNKTPKRNVAQKLQEMEERLVSGKLDSRSKVVLERSKLCTGFAVWCIGDDGTSNGKGSRGCCSNCGAQTHCYCVGCKRWLCHSLSDKAESLPGWKSHVIINPAADKPIHCQATCFFIQHREAQRASLLRLNEQCQF